MGKQKHFYAYLAGFIDGEGCIGFSKTKRKRAYYDKNDRLRCPMGTLYIHAFIEISNTCLKTIEYIKENIGYGEIYTSKRKRLNHKVQYKLVIAKQKQILDILEATLPFIFTKKEQSLLMLEFCKSRLKANKGRGRFYSARDLEIPEISQRLKKGI